MGNIFPIGVQLGRLAEAAPDAAAISDGAMTLTRRELNLRSNRLARALASVGVRHGDLVSVGLANTVDFVETCYALWKLGATPQPISFRLPAAETNAIMELADSPILVAASTMASDRPRYDVKTLLAMSDDDRPLEPAIAPSFKAPTSGGSTGRPKLIVATTPGVVDCDAPALYGILPTDTVVVPAPLYYNGPFLATFMAINMGAHVVILPRFDPEQTLALIERFKGSWLYMVPTMMSRIWKLGDELRGRYDVSSLRAVWHMAAPCPAWLKQVWIEWLGPDAIMELYAGTEAQAATAISGREWMERPGSVGKAIMGEMKIVDPQGNRVPAGEIGEIYMRGNEAGYIYRGADPRVDQAGWESIGDLGYFDEAGYLFLADRRTDLIIVGGANVYPAEIEAAIDSHPDVLSSAVIGLPEPEMGAQVHAIVQGRDCLHAEALETFLKSRLAPYKLPRSFEFVDVGLRDDGGKVRRSQLREDRLPKPT